MSLLRSGALAAGSERSCMAPSEHPHPHRGAVWDFRHKRRGREGVGVGGKRGTMVRKVPPQGPLSRLPSGHCITPSVAWAVETLTCRCGSVTASGTQVLPPPRASLAVSWSMPHPEPWPLLCTHHFPNPSSPVPRGRGPKDPRVVRNPKGEGGGGAKDPPSCALCNGRKGRGPHDPRPAWEA